MKPKLWQLFASTTTASIGFATIMLFVFAFTTGSNSEWNLALPFAVVSLFCFAAVGPLIWYLAESYLSSFVKNFWICHILSLFIVTIICASCSLFVVIYISDISIISKWAVSFILNALTAVLSFMCYRNIFFE